MHKNHGKEFKYIGIDLFDQKSTYEDEVEPAFTFNNPLKNFYFKYIKRQNPYSEIAVNDLLMKFKENIKIIKGDTNIILKVSANKNGFAPKEKIGLSHPINVPSQIRPKI